MTDNVLNLHTRTPRAVLQQVMDMLDSGKVDNFILIAQGWNEDRQERVLVPATSGNLTVSDVTIAAAVVDEYRARAVRTILESPTNA